MASKRHAVIGINRMYTRRTAVSIQFQSVRIIDSHFVILDLL